MQFTDKLHNSFEIGHLKKPASYPKRYFEEPKILRAKNQKDPEFNGA